MKKNNFLRWSVFTFMLCLLFFHLFNKTLIAENANIKYEVYVLQDQNARGVGHLAILLGNKDVGFSYFSKSKDISNNINGEHFESIEAFYSRVSRYQKNYMIEISSQQYDTMINVSKNIINNYYHRTENSCVDFVQFVLTSGNINAGTHDMIWPKECFDYITANNIGKKDLVTSPSTSSKTPDSDEIDLSGKWVATSIDSNGIEYKGELKIMQTGEFITAISTTGNSIWNGSFDRQKKIVNATYTLKNSTGGKVTLWVLEDGNTLQGTWSHTNAIGYGTYMAKR